MSETACEAYARARKARRMETCEVCGVAWEDHPGVQRLCAEVQALREEVKGLSGLKGSLQKQGCGHCGYPSAEVENECTRCANQRRGMY